jgi:threonine dehydratase
MRFYAERMKMIVEPTGCLSLAGARVNDLNLKNSRIGIVVSGGNVDLSRYAKLVGDPGLEG